MGIKNLLKFLSEYENILIEKEFSSFSGKKIAIDISILIYQMVIAIRNSGSDLINDKGEITSHILGLFNKTLKFLEKGIIPIYVFDGKPPLIKHKLLETRKLIKQKALDKLSEANSELDKIKYLKRSVTINKEQIEQCRELLKLMGIPFINAPEEADSELAYLCKNNLVYAVLTEDMDILTFGSPKIIRNLISDKKKPVEIDLNNILHTLNLNYDQFIDLCILFGCDYCPQISDIKPNQIYNIYIKHKNIDKTLEEIKNLNYYIPDNYYLNYNNAKKYFLDSQHNLINSYSLNLYKPNNDLLLNLLVNKYGFIKFKVINKLNKLNEFYLKYKY